MNKKEKTNIILKAQLAKIISDEWPQPTKQELSHICQHTDFNKVPDRTVADNDDLHAIIPWERLDRMKIVRVVARNAKIADFLDLSKYNYTIRELKHMLRICPYLIDRFNIDLGKISHNDAFLLLTIGVEELSERIDVKKYKFNPLETYEIIEFNSFSEDLILNLDLRELKDYHICNIIINTGDLYFYKLNLTILTARKWVEILQSRPELFRYCDLEKFKHGDIFNSVELVCLFPQEKLDYLITERDYKSELSAFGWEKLIINKPNEYIDLCCYWKLNDINWKNIAVYHPNLIAYKN